MSNHGRLFARQCSFFFDINSQVCKSWRLAIHYYGLGEACPMKLDSSGVAEAPLYNPYLGLQKTHKESYQPSLRIVAFPGYFHCRRQREALMGGK